MKVIETIANLINPYWYIGAAAVLSFLGAWFIQIRSDVENREKDAQNTVRHGEVTSGINDVTNLTLANQEIGQATKTLTEAVNETSNQNQELSKSIEEITSLTQRFVTGGDTFVIVDMSWGGDNKPIFFLTVKGRYALRNVRIQIGDAGKFEYLFEKNGRNYYMIEEIQKQSNYLYEYPVLYGNTTQELPIPYEPGINNFTFRVVVFSENGTTDEILKVFDVNGPNRRVEVEIKREDIVIYHNP